MQRGFTYLVLLFFVAITSAALAALGQSWSQAAQREQERELQFRGEEIARAILSYLQVPGPAPQYPRSLEDLLADHRGAKTRHHLRRVYADPFTGAPDWVLVPAPTDARGFHAVHSRSERPLLRQLNPDSPEPSRASGWLFSIEDIQAKPGPAAPAASAPTGG